MKKHWKEEIQDLKSGIKFHSLFIPLFLFFYNEVSGQIAINGFCKYESIEVGGGFTNLYSLNINGDAHTDLILFSPRQNKFNLLAGASKELFEKQIDNNVSHPFSSLDNFSSKQKNKEGHVFVSRTKKKFGFVRFDKKGNVAQIKSVSLKSFPDKLLSEDFDNDGANETAICGVGYSGISIMTEKNGKFLERNFALQYSYVELASFLINGDEFLDIAAFEPLSNQIHFYFNDGKSNFTLSRKIDAVRNLSQLHSFDFNLDGFTDLIYEQDGNITVQLGDEEGFFNRQLKIVTKHKPDKFIYGDFNKDGLIDLAYLNKEFSSVYVLFQKDENNFASEFLILKKDFLSDLIPFYSRFIDGILSLSESGQLFLISRLNRFGDETKLIFASDEPALDFFDYSKNTTPDFAILDGTNKRIKLIIRNDAGIPALYYEIPTLEKYRGMIIWDREPFKKYFILFNRYKNEIQIITADLKNFKIVRSFIYADGSIFDLKLETSAVSAKPKIYVSVKINLTQYISAYEEIEGKYSRKSMRQIDENISRFFFTESEKLFYWKEAGYQNSLYFKENILAPAIKLYSYNQSESEKIFSEYLSSNVSSSVYSYFISEQINFLLARNENAQNIVRSSILSEIDGEGKFILKSVRAFKDGGSQIYLYLPHQNSLYNFELKTRMNKIISTKILEMQSEKDFSVQRLMLKDNYAIYFQRADNHLTLAKLK